MGLLVLEKRHLSHHTTKEVMGDEEIIELIAEFHKKGIFVVLDEIMGCGGRIHPRLFSVSSKVLAAFDAILFGKAIGVNGVLFSQEKPLVRRCPPIIWERYAECTTQFEDATIMLRSTIIMNKMRMLFNDAAYLEERSRTCNMLHTFAKTKSGDAAGFVLMLPEERTPSSIYSTSVKKGMTRCLFPITYTSVDMERTLLRFASVNILGKPSNIKGPPMGTAYYGESYISKSDKLQSMCTLRCVVMEFVMFKLLSLRYA